MRRVSNLQICETILLIGLLTPLYSGCKPKASVESGAQNSSLGVAQHAFYQCTTSTIQKGVRYSYQLSTLNNTTSEISLQLDAANTPTLTFAELKKQGTDRWSESSKFAVHLVNKSDGSKGILVNDLIRGFKINPENSFCITVCSGPTRFVDGRCLWTGATEESVIGNLIIETIGTAGLGTVWRAAALSRSMRAASSASVSAGASAVLDAKATMLVLDSPLRTGAQKIASAKTFEEALEHLSKALQKTNPLSGTSVVGHGNCANDAMTQLVSLVLGRWACAIPYPKGKLGYATMKNILDDLIRLVGVRESHRAIDDLTSFSSNVLARKMVDGDVALLFSKGPNAGHATLVTKIKGQLVHINNQNWPDKFQPLEHWDTLWRATFGGKNPQYQVFVVSKKLIGF